MTLASLLALWFTVHLSKKRAQRIEIQKQKWKDIKELEEDYDVYVSDEYAHHIADAKMQMQQLQEFDIDNMERHFTKVAAMRNQIASGGINNYMPINHRQHPMTSSNNRESGSFT
jgi:queuine/archaeosine tRNA-ribosyltransferase